MLIALKLLSAANFFLSLVAARSLPVKSEAVVIFAKNKPDVPKTSHIAPIKILNVPQQVSQSVEIGNTAAANTSTRRSLLSENDEIHIERRGLGFIHQGYYTNWGIYSGYQPSQVPAESLSHISYSFANVNSSTGAVYLTDSYSDEQMRFTTGVEDPDPADNGTPDNNLYGNLKRLNLIKRKYRHTKLMLVIGGWTYSPNFWPVLSGDGARSNFAKSAVAILENYGFDGFEVDWEYADDTQKAEAYVELLRVLRQELDMAQGRSGFGSRFYIASAIPAGDSNIQPLDIRGMNRYVDFFTVLSLDYAGSWSETSGYHANLYYAPDSPASEANTDEVIRKYLAKGAPPNKLVVGLPLYGRSFANTDGLGKPFSGVSSEVAEGIYLTNQLPQQGAKVVQDFKAGASYSYDPQKRLFISYDTLPVFGEKIEYVKSRFLAGASYWELTGDFSSGSQSPAVIPHNADQLGWLDMTPNWLHYPNSKFDNVRNGFK